MTLLCCFFNTQFLTHLFHLRPYYSFFSLSTLIWEYFFIFYSIYWPTYFWKKQWMKKIRTAFIEQTTITNVWCSYKRNRNLVELQLYYPCWFTSKLKIIEEFIHVPHWVTFFVWKTFTPQRNSCSTPSHSLNLKKIKKN